MNLGVIGDSTIYLLNPKHLEWISSTLLNIYERAQPTTLVTYDEMGTALLARRLVKSIPRIVLTDVDYKLCKPKFADVTIVDNNISAWVDYVVIIGNGQPNYFYGSHRYGKIYEINYLEKSAKWVKYADNISE